jgi:hypothetical protein
LQTYLEDHLYEQEFTSILVDIFSNIMWTHFCFYVDPRASAWLLTRLITPTFHLSLAHFLIALYTHLGLSHPIVAHLFYGVNVVIPLTNYVPTCFGAFVGVNIQQPMIHFGILSQLLFWRVEHMFNGRYPTFSFTTLDNEWISLSS